MAELAKLKKEDMTPDDLAQLRQKLAEFFMDLGLFGAARLGLYLYIYLLFFIPNA